MLSQLSKFFLNSISQGLVVFSQSSFNFFKKVFIPSLSLRAVDRYTQAADERTMLGCHGVALGG